MADSSGGRPGDGIEGLVLRRLDPERYADFRVVGSGGMGIVYRTVDREMGRAIALKTLRTDPARDPGSPLRLEPPTGDEEETAAFERLSARLLHEARVTGALEHPGIVPVHEVGHTPAGIPYYTMRLLPGERTLLGALLGADDLDERLDWLDVFVRICDTVAFAHSRGVIHRDLKPANIGLGEFGEVVVLDWGVAKVAGAEDFAAESWRRRHDMLRTSAAPVGTPGFMSPEAASGEPQRLDERSDVYSLGVILYAILTGRMPWRAGDFHELVQKLSTKPPPSARVEEPDVPDGLSRICARAMARRPEDRFGSAGKLGNAVRRWQRASRVEREVLGLAAEAEAALDGADRLPADARIGQVERALGLLARASERAPGHVDVEELEERCRSLRDAAIRDRERAARRRVLRVGAAVVLVLATLAALGFARILDGERRRAERARDRAEDLASFLLFDLHDRLEAIGRLDVLGEAARKVQEHYGDTADPELPREARRNRVVALAHVAEVLRLEGDLSAAVAALETALAGARLLLDEDPDDELARHDLALTALKLGRLRLRADEPDAAGPLFAAARSKLAALATDFPEDPKYREGLATTWNRAGELRERSGDAAAAAEAYDRALAIRAELAARADADADALLDHARSLERRVRLRLGAGDRDGARADLRESLSIRRRVARALPLDAPPLREVAGSLTVLGDLFLDEEDPEGALDAYRDAAGLSRRLSAADPENTSAARDLSVALGRVSAALRAAGEIEEALGPARESREIRGRLLERDPANPKWQEDLASAEYREGRLHQLLGRGEPARELLEASAARRRRLAAGDDPDVGVLRELAFTLLRLSQIAENGGDLEAARTLQREATAAHARAADRAPRLRSDQARFEERLEELRDR